LKTPHFFIYLFTGLLNGTRHVLECFDDYEVRKIIRACGEARKQVNGMKSVDTVDTLVQIIQPACQSLIVLAQLSDRRSVMNHNLILFVPWRTEIFFFFSFLLSIIVAESLSCLSPGPRSPLPRPARSSREAPPSWSPPPRPSSQTPTSHPRRAPRNQGGSALTGFSTQSMTLRGSCRSSRFVQLSFFLSLLNPSPLNDSGSKRLMPFPPSLFFFFFLADSSRR